ncbi:hypothetical protein BN7_6769 [Wickerhamomyces ciferrii]|uniref:ATP-dependent DNA helicase n=1 Tax=Wickerhamomyces ciferrii (strain ATCC 14091 / BCRC 22168 / CBS 111 / JCM 3599 / NBRC 0793 / NRRL Y-1031 F-60-10) TaxID=1206466 RepID=K0L0R1_WICCF|nr:uncharacterized protein BN7_6769 [Wickerhamomyces ciferrii]CCH47154.1 hypothetical protein BN7_6769 [Wickerhamomyces ciferrii]
MVQDEVVHLDNVIYLNGSAGSGKSTLLNVLMKNIGYKSIICTSATGSASNVLIGGGTLHSTFKIPTDEDSFIEVFNCLKRKSLNLKMYRHLKDKKLLIIDEISMVENKILDFIDLLLRKLRNNEGEMFGGICTILCGDFKQLLPVIQNADPALIANSAIANKDFFRSIDKFYLSKNVRLRSYGNNVEDNKNRDEFLEFLEQIRKTKVKHVEVPKFLKYVVDDDLEMIRKMFPKDILTSDNFFGENMNESSVMRINNLKNILNYFSDSRIIANRIENVARFNEKSMKYYCEEISKQQIFIMEYDDYLFEKFEAITYEIDSVTKEKSKKRTQNVSKYRIPRFIQISKYCPLLVNMNLNKSQKLTNGVIVLVLDFNMSRKELKVGYFDLNGNFKEFYIGVVGFIDMMVVAPKSLIRYGFPCSLGFASTVHKSQGQSVTNLGIDIRDEVFGHGQLYVAFSRARDFKKVLLMKSSEDQIEITNINYEELEYTDSNETIIIDENQNT